MVLGTHDILDSLSPDRKLLEQSYITLLLLKVLSLVNSATCSANTEDFYLIVTCILVS